MRLLIEAGRERKERRSTEGRYKDNAIRLVVNILPSHTAICNFYGTMRNERKGNSFHKGKKTHHILFSATHAYFPTLELCSPKMSVGGQPGSPDYRKEGHNREQQDECAPLR